MATEKRTAADAAIEARAYRYAAYAIEQEILRQDAADPVNAAMQALADTFWQRADTLEQEGGTRGE